MATIQIEIDDEKIHQLLRGDRGMAVLLEPILNQILQAEMTEHLGAEPDEQTDDRRGYRNGSYERKLTTRVGTIELEVPRDREGTFQTALFQRYQRSEKALVLTLMQMVVQGVSTRRVKEITTELCGREFSKCTAPPLGRRAGRASSGLGRAAIEAGISVPDPGRHATQSPVAEGRPGDRHAGRWHKRGRAAGDFRA